MTGSMNLHSIAYIKVETVSINGTTWTTIGFVDENGETFSVHAFPAERGAVPRRGGEPEEEVAT